VNLTYSLLLNWYNLGKTIFSAVAKVLLYSGAHADVNRKILFANHRQHAWRPMQI